jgi:hypothetical protein
MYFNSPFDNQKFWIYKKCINNVYDKFESASNGVDIKLYFWKLMGFI